MTSMTGHGRGEARADGWAAIVECFSVNRKSAEVACHAEAADWLEPVVRERVLARIARGRVQVNAKLVHENGPADGLVDRVRAKAFVREAKKLQKELGVPGELTLSDVLAAPGVVLASEPETSGARRAVLGALDKALDGLVATRAKEGLALAKAVTRSVRQMRRIHGRIVPLAGAVKKAQRDSLLRRVAQAGLTITADDPRLLAEVALFAERSDITEELDRIASHLDQFEDKIQSGGVVGRTLEFLTQELGREWNTVGSKSSSTGITRLVIDAKAELDRIREQLANIE
ncbi:MAG: YicC/YloC family endoribonuclease [Terrimicrobiaceae bacterium]|nr:YicC/YloC family endoribonuclease [Terrimicrobiaceae bacterium]